MDCTVVSQPADPGFDSRLEQDRSVRSLHVLPMPAWVSSGYSGVPPHQKLAHTGIVLRRSL